MDQPFSRNLIDTPDQLHVGMAPHSFHLAFDLTDDILAGYFADTINLILV